VTASPFAQKHFACRAVLPILLVAAVGAPVAAQDHPAPAALQAAYEMAACMVKRTPAQSRHILAYAPTSDEAIQAFIAAHPAECLDGSTNGNALTLKGPFQRGAIAEYLVVRDFSAIGVPKGKVGPIFAPLDAAAMSRLKPMGQQTLAGLAVAECAVRAEPQKSFAVFGTKLGSQEERTALTALLPAIGRCVRPEQAIDMEMASLRALLGEAAYRVSVSLSQRASR
jgi:hypothetical protein